MIRSVNRVVRVLLGLFVLFSLTYWGYYAWPFPLPGLFFVIGAPLFAVVVWALFRSRRAVFPLDPVGRAVVEIFIMGAAAIAWLMLGHPVIALVFAVIAAASGALHARADVRSDAS